MKSREPFLHKAVIPQYRWLGTCSTGLQSLVLETELNFEASQTAARSCCNSTVNGSSPAVTDMELLVLPRLVANIAKYLCSVHS